MSAFETAAAALFRDPNMGVDAIYRPGGIGGGVLVRVIRSAPDRLARFGDGSFVTDTVAIDVAIAEAPGLAEGDSFEIGGTHYILHGAPIRDADRLVWSAEAREA
jgi:hypothetical protein